MEDTVKRALLVALIAGVLGLIQWFFRRFFPRQAAWLAEHLGERQRKLGAFIMLGGFLLFISVFVVNVFVLRTHRLSWLGWGVFWTGVGICAVGALLVTLQVVFGKGQPAPKVNDEKR